MRRVVGRPRLGTALLIHAVAGGTVVLVLRLPLRRFARHRAMRREPTRCNFHFGGGELCPRNESKSIKRGNKQVFVYSSPKKSMSCDQMPTKCAAVVAHP